MERPPKKCVCEKCGYLGDTSEHEGCDYLAWTTGEQLYIDHLERDLALLKASPASAPEGTNMDKQYLSTEFDSFFEFPSDDKSQVSSISAKLFAEHIAYPIKAEVERLRDEIAALRQNNRELLDQRFDLMNKPTPQSTEDRKDAERFRDGWTHSCNALCMEIELWIDRCPHCGRPAPKAPTMQEDKP